MQAACCHCSRTGYLGRTGIFEIFTITSSVREHIVSGSTEATIRNTAAKAGMPGLFYYAMAKVKDGITSEEEVLRVIDAAVLM